MGLLRATPDGAIVCLGSQALVGRAPECELRLSSKLASSAHALLRWTAGGWTIRDVGSRNGTFLGDDRLEPGRDVPLPRGARLSFGDRSAPWELVHAGPPGPAALRPDGVLAASENGLLALPDPERPLVVVLPDDERWVVERDDELEEARDGLALELEGARWTLLLPRTPVRAPVGTTLEAGVDDVSEAVLSFSVSQDEENVALEILTPAARVPLTPRTHHFVLLALARARLEDARLGVSAAEQGWVHQEELCRMLRLEPALLSLHLFRAREQVAAAGLPFAARLLERRRLSRQVRLGPARVEVRKAGEG